MEQPPEGTPEKLSEYLTRYFNSLILSVNSLKDTVRLWNKNGFTGTFIGNLTGNVLGNLTGNVTGNSLAFPATQVSSANANTLDDYEEGAFNPVVTASSGAITSYTSVGTYTKIGNLVSFHFSVTITNKGTGTAGLKVTLPFTCVSTSIGSGRENAVTGVMCQLTAFSTYCNILDYSNATIIATNNIILGSITYQAAT
jgi:hypothetical protein